VKSKYTILKEAIRRKDANKITWSTIGTLQKLMCCCFPRFEMECSQMRLYGPIEIIDGGHGSPSIKKLTNNSAGQLF
jgi:hypothetical protein